MARVHGVGAVMPVVGQKPPIVHGVTTELPAGQKAPSVQLLVVAVALDAPQK
jgi:hypothetical protein